MNANLRRHSFWIVGVAFCGVVYGLFLFVSYPEWNKYRRLHQSGKETMGTVVDKEPARHRRIHYTYQVGPRLYTGIVDAGLASLPFDDIRNGDHLTVIYLADNPDTSVAGEVTTLYFSWSRLLFVIGPCVCLLLTVPLAVAVWRTTRRTKSP
jgi:hypothetical protein